MRSDPNCIFCKIVAKQIPASIVHETDAIVAFLDVNPLASGHLLIVPREHHEQIVEMTGETVGHLAALLPNLGRVLVEVSGAAGFSVLQNNGAVAGQVVPHVHFHLIPRAPDDGLGYRWNAGSYPPGRAAELADAFRAAMMPAV